jgi:Family of unknown function (DUF5752)
MAAQIPGAAPGHVMNELQPFVFYTERRLVLLTGRRATNLDELLAHLGQVSGSSIFYHTHHQYLSHHFETPVFHSDFASWISHALLQEELAEKLATIDILSFTSIRQLRDAIIATVQTYMQENAARSRSCIPGDEFHFCESMSFIMPTGIVAKDIRDFFTKLATVTNISLYYHFFEARLRLERSTNDFSMWLRLRGENELARAVDRLNPYVMTLDELKDEIITLGNSERIVDGHYVA